MKMYEAVHLIKSGRAVAFFPPNVNFEYGIEDGKLFILLDKNKISSKVSLETVDLKQLCSNDEDTVWEVR